MTSHHGMSQGSLPTDAGEDATAKEEGGGEWGEEWGEAGQLGISVLQDAIINPTTDNTRKQDCSCVSDDARDHKQVVTEGGRGGGHPGVSENKATSEGTRGSKGKLGGRQAGVEEPNK